MTRLKICLRLTRRLFRTLVGNDLFIKIDTVYPLLTIGNEGTAWTIVPDLVEKGGVAYTIGVGKDMTLDRVLAGKFEMDVHAFDPTPRSIDWVSTQTLEKNLTFHPFGLADTDGCLYFEEPARSDHVSYSASNQSFRPTISLPVKRLSTIAQELGHSQIAILKMDIEGSEYGVIEDFRNHSLRPKQLLIEFHHRFSNFGATKTKKSINLLKELNYRIAHVSQCGEEILFVHGNY